MRTNWSGRTPAEPRGAVYRPGLGVRNHNPRIVARILRMLCFEGALMFCTLDVGERARVRPAVQRDPSEPDFDVLHPVVVNGTGCRMHPSAGQR